LNGLKYEICELPDSENAEGLPSARATELTGRFVGGTLNIEAGRELPMLEQQSVTLPGTARTNNSRKQSLPTPGRETDGGSRSPHEIQTPLRGASDRPMTPIQAAEFLRMDEKTITRWARRGYIPAHPMGEGKRKFWRFFEHELLDW